MIEFGSTLKKVRLAQGLSQQQVADKLNLTRQTISKWENGRGYPDFENLILLSELYGVTIDQLVNRRTLNLDPVQVLTMNKKREKAMWLTRQAKIFLTAILLSIVAYTIIWWGKSAYETYRDQTALAPYVVYVKNVKRVGKVTRKEGPGITRLLKITSITLDNGDIILNPTVAKLKKRKLIVEINPWRDESEQNAYSISKRILAKNEK
ncbi:helix-turn-helix domain-containing protein [Schleiferilactobacillus harbinensis]|uniref:Helix-turn-helix domain-containing protein n=1 Tax=Schleiferilactobacillus harbinensis TaxID=304207 RepID=A0A5P8M399_9LACO|nr:helix-turn-helix transcriptional regulator [Schleiferilactobacillus harbinensis]QFR22745.1 helix-turn-helix domain-containing protein [Schleiferilactobacillus harbinensis]